MSSINILVALTCEAKPLIRYFKLQREHQYEEFAIFVRNNMRLVVTGIGQINMAAACGWLTAIASGFKKTTNDIWLNVGTAGHGNLEKGEIFVVNQVANNCERVYYPPLIVKWKGEYSALQTVDHPSHQYHQGLAFDMEAYAFFLAAQKFTSAELVQSIKVVSDNPENSIEQLNAKTLSELIENQLPQIENYIDRLSQLAASIPGADASEDVQRILKKFHFTQTQKHQLNELWRRWQVLKANTKQSEIDVSNCSNAKQIIQLLSDKLQTEPKV